MHFHDLRHMALHNFANKKNISVSDCMIISGHKEQEPCCVFMQRTDQKKLRKN